MAQRQNELLLLALILLIGGYFRFTGLNWDGGTQLHPDERFLTMVEGAIKPAAIVPRPSGPGQQAQGAPVFEQAGLLSYYFDAQRSGLNPHNVGHGFFVYGTFPLFATRFLVDQLQGLGLGFERMPFQVIGRFLSAFSDLVTVALVYLIGWRLYGSRVGLLGAALTAACVMHIQQAHFFVFDSFLVTLVAACFYFCVDIAETGRLRSFALAGVFLGLSLATKLSMVTFVPILALAALVYLWRTADLSRRGLDGDVIAQLWADGLIIRMVTGGAVALLVAGFTFRVFQPYAFAGPNLWDLRLNPRWLDNIQYQAKSQDGSVDLPPSIQWAGTEPLLFPWRHMVAWGMGIPLGLTAWAGFTAAALAFLRRGRWQHLLLVAWSALCFVYFASVLNKTMRYVLPMYPFIILLGAWALVALYDWTKRQRLEVLNDAFLVGRAPTAPGALDAAVEADGVTGASPIRTRPALRDRASVTWRRLRPLVAEWGPSAAVALGGFVLVASTLWAVAFTRIYTRPTSRVMASQWIYQNVPKPAVMANEHWDDPLPVPIPNFDHGAYAGPALPLYDVDEPRKLDTIVQMLTQSSYINITSNRLYGSIPRIPQRYPMATEYYRALFAGELGYKLVATIASYPTLGPWVINDDRAEEAFTVYDHPKVLIFQKQPDFSAEKVRQVLGKVPLDNVVNLTPIQVGRPNLVMPPALRAANLNGGTWSDQFSLDGIANALAPLTWYLAIQALGLLAAPLLWLLLPRLPDRGYGIAKALGLLFVSWVAWTLAGYRLLPWTRLTLLLAVLVLAGVAVLALRRAGGDWLAWMRGHRRVLLAAEGTFLAAYLLVLLFRAANPDLWHPGRGGEKPMEFSYLNAVIKTTYFPPYDPWYAGGYLNYYYFGYVLIAALVKLTGVMPSVSFNVALATLYGLTAAGCFSFVYNLSRLGGRPRFSLRAALGAGVLGFVLVALAGNLDGFSQLIERLARASGAGVSSGLPGVAGLWSIVTGLPAVIFGGQKLAEFDFWRSSRIIPNNTINEFPFWTFLFSDLHAHLISIPFQVTALTALLGLAHTGKQPARDPDSVLIPQSSALSLTRLPTDGRLLGWLWGLFGWRRVAEIVFAGWLVGALYVINSWEFPTYLLLTAATFVIAEFVAQRGLTLGGLVRAGISAAGVFLLAKPLFRPFWQWYVTFYSSVTPWTQDKSRLDHYLVIHGVFVFSLITFALLLGAGRWAGTGWGRYLAARWRSLSAWDRFGELERAFLLQYRAPATGYAVLLSVTAVLTLGFLLRGLGLIAFLVPLLALLVAAAWERRDSPALLFASLLAATGTALSIFVEFFALQGDIGRMNTVFKFYLQLWVMWALVSAAALAWGFDRIMTAARTVVLPAPAAPVYASPPRALVFDDPVAAGAGDGDPWAGEPLDAPAAPLASGTPSDSVLSPQSSALSWWQYAWAGGAACLLLAALAYPLGATPARLADRFNPLPPTLDGMAYMPFATIDDGNSEVRGQHPQGVRFSGAEDYAAIRWLLENTQGSLVVLEASIPEYRWGSRVAKYTGLPAVLGWRWHQVQQRGTYAPQVDARLRDVQTMFGDPNPARVTPLLDKYGVRYIYVGDLERAYYSAAGIGKFDQMADTLRPVYQQGSVTIYEVLGQNGPRAQQGS